MAFSSARLDPERLARVPFGDAWRSLADPSDAGRCDPHDVHDRLALYRLLIERVHTGGAFGAHDEQHPLWGYAQQLAWQHASGRLGGAGRAIDPASWWGACNYALSVVPYVAAMQLALVPRLPIEIDRAYGPAMPEWHAALRAIRDVQADRDHEPMRLAVWRAHLTSIGIAVARHRDERRAMPAHERRFARGWVRMVDVFGAAGVRTDLARISEPAARAALPSRVLSDAPEQLPRGERGVARRIVALGARPAWRWELELRAWRRLMRSAGARREHESLLAAMFGRGERVWASRLRALRYFAVPSLG